MVAMDNSLFLRVKNQGSQVKVHYWTCIQLFKLECCSEVPLVMTASTRKLLQMVLMLLLNLVGKYYQILKSFEKVHLYGQEGKVSLACYEIAKG